MRRCGAPLPDELVANATHGEQMPRLSRHGFDLFSHPTHMDIDGAAAAEELVSPDLLEQLLACENLTGVLREEVQQVKFLRLQCEFCAAT